MIFSNLAGRLQETLRKLRGKGKLTEIDVDEALREVKLALLEADVNFRVVRSFINRVRERAVGKEVTSSLTPGQMVVKIVHQELTALMGAKEEKIRVAPQPPTVVLLVGLQGSGKTTTTAKLGRYLKMQGRRPMLAAADIYRPAAVRQLQILGEKLELPVYFSEGKDPVAIAREAVAAAKKQNCDYLLVDTAGRLHVNEELMEELRAIKEAVRPEEILLVVDAMTGQDAVNVARSFHEKLSLTGLVLTKLESDTRGGAALSIREVTGCPLNWWGPAKKWRTWRFLPGSAGLRILGMGDVLTLIEKAEAAVEKDQARDLFHKIQDDRLTLEDFLEQMRQLRKSGLLQQALSFLPGVNPKHLRGMQVSEEDFKHLEAIIQSMTPEERRNPSIINASRRKRIARGSGRSIQEVNRLLNQFEQSKKLMKQLARMGKGGFPMKFPFP